MWNRAPILRAAANAEIAQGMVKGDYNTKAESESGQSQALAIENAHHALAEKDMTRHFGVISAFSIEGGATCAVSKACSVKVCFRVAARS